MRQSLLIGAAVVAGLAALIAADPAAALAGYRVAFLVGAAVPAGAVLLLLIARLTGADWAPALLPFARPVPWLALAFLPVVAGQALAPAPPEHLRIWLSPPLFALRGLLLIGLWWWLARRLASALLGPLGAGLGLLAHGIGVTLIAPDWLLGLAPGQPNSAAGMVLATFQIAAASAAVGLSGLGERRTRHDLAKLRVAACFGTAYLLFMDYLIIWFGELPERVDWYVPRAAPSWGLLPPIALALSILPAVIAAAAPSRPIERAASCSILAALWVTALWLIAPGFRWIAPAAGAVAALGLPASLLRVANR